MQYDHQGFLSYLFSTLEARGVPFTSLQTTLPSWLLHDIFHPDVQSSQINRSMLRRALGIRPPTVIPILASYMVPSNYDQHELEHLIIKGNFQDIHEHAHKFVPTGPVRKLCLVNFGCMLSTTEVEAEMSFYRLHHATITELLFYGEKHPGIENAFIVALGTTQKCFDLEHVGVIHHRDSKQKSLWVMRLDRVWGSRHYFLAAHTK